MAHPRDIAFLTVIAWPPGSDREQCARLLAKASGLAVDNARLAAGRAVPAPMASLDEATARQGAEAMRRAGAEAEAITLAQIASLGPTIKIKSMSVAHGGDDRGELELELWRGKPTRTRLPFADIDVIVRGTIKSSKVKPFSETDMGMGWDATGGGDFGGGGGYDFPFFPRFPRGTISGDSDGIEPIPTRYPRDVKVTELLDLHASDGRVFQVDGGKFAFEVLGDLRGVGDRRNMETLVEMLSHGAAYAIVDRCFELFRPPNGFKRMRVKGASIDVDDPAFAFYSRWVALVYRLVKAGPVAGLKPPPVPSEE